MLSATRVVAAAASLSLLLMLALEPAITEAQARDSLQAIMNDFWNWRMQEFPALATFSGEHAYDDKLENYTIASLENRYKKAFELLSRLDTLDRSELNATQELNFVMLHSAIKDSYVDGYKWMRYVAVNPMNYLEGVSVNEISALLLPTNRSRHEDYNSVIARLEAYPGLISQQIDLLREAMTTSMINHNVSMTRIAANINGTVSTPANSSDFYKAFGSDLDDVTAISAEDKVDLRAKALSAIHTIYEALRNVSTFVSQEYMPRTRTFVGVSGFPKGGEFYQACLNWHTTTTLTAQDIHDQGLSEVKRIQKNMEDVKNEAGFNGTLRQFQDSLREDPQFYYKTAAELLAGYKELIEKVDTKLSLVFGDDTMPNVPCDVVPMKTDGPGGQYNAPLKPGDPGRFIVNLNQPEKRAKFSMMALTLHEANPGHHYQSVAQLNAPGLPDFRRYTDYTKYYSVPFHFPFQTAYTEGWALYAESLGEEIGVYETPYEKFGRYSSEIFRASRLVVDTGLHAFRWSRQQAVDYMMNTTFDVKEQIENEIDRYITWPGQACAYKIGELKIKQLRNRAEEAFGSTFDVKKYHSQVLQLGSVPLTVLDNYINKWICTETGKHCANNNGSTTASNSTLLLQALFAVLIYIYTMRL